MQLVFMGGTVGNTKDQRGWWRVQPVSPYRKLPELTQTSWQRR